MVSNPSTLRCIPEASDAVRFRLADIDAPELNTEEGRKARDFVFSRLMSARTIIVKTQRTDLHSRYVTHLFYSAVEMSVDERRC